MLSSEKNIEAIAHLASDLKDYVELKFEYAKIEAAQKSTQLISAIVVGIIVLILVAAIIAFISFTLAFALAKSIGSTVIAFGIVTLCYVALLITVFSLRKRLIERPLARFFGELLLDENEEKHQSPNSNML